MTASSNPEAQRVKVKTTGNLPKLQAWLSIKPTQTILDLKKSIWELLEKPKSITPREIILEHDGFAFLDQSFCSVIDSHDLIMVRARPQVNNPQSKKSGSKKKKRSREVFEADNPSQNPVPSESRQSKSSKITQDSSAKPIQQQDTSTVSKKNLPSDLQKNPLKQAAQHSKTAPACSQNNPEKNKTTPHQISKDCQNNPKSASSVQRSQNPNHPDPVSNNPSENKRPPAPPGEGSKRTKARNERKRLKKALERQAKQNKVDNPDQTQVTELALTDANHQRDLVTVKPSQTLAGQKKKVEAVSSHTQKGKFQPSSGSDTSEGDESAEADSSTSEFDPSESDASALLTSTSGNPMKVLSAGQVDESTDESSTTNSSTSESGSDSSDSESSAPSSAPIQKSLSDPLVSQILQRTVPTLQDPKLNMLSLSNKNKRKNLKRTPHNSNQMPPPSKIVFESPTTAQQKPTRSPSSSNSQTAPTFAPEMTDAITEDYDESRLASRHGPPPSQRSPHLIPPSILITSIDVLDQNWEPGQIGDQFLSSATTTSKSKQKRDRNRRKRLARQRRADLKSNYLENEGKDNYDEENGRLDFVDDVEIAYAEFISSGGHNLKSNEEEREEKLMREFKVIKDSWDTYQELNRADLQIGDKIGIKVIEFSLDSLTPECLIYYGNLVKSDEERFTIGLEPSCLPKAVLQKRNLKLGQVEQFASNEYEEWEGGEGEMGEAEGKKDYQDMFRESLRENVMDELWNECLVGDERDENEGESAFWERKLERSWEWNNVNEFRKII